MKNGLGAAVIPRVNVVGFLTLTFVKISKIAVYLNNKGTS